MEQDGRLILRLKAADGEGQKFLAKALPSFIFRDNEVVDFVIFKATEPQKTSLFSRINICLRCVKAFPAGAAVDRKSFQSDSHRGEAAVVGVFIDMKVGVGVISQGKAAGDFRTKVFHRMCNNIQF